MSSLIPNEIAELFESGVSILVGTRDAKHLPEASLGAGAVVHPDRRRLTIFLPTAASERALANVRDNGLIAVGFSSPLDHKTLQVKGRVEEVRPATEAEREIIIRYRAAYAEVLYFAGVPRATTRRIDVWPAVAVTFEVTALFQQTPGPNAGEPLKTKT